MRAPLVLAVVLALAPAQCSSKYDPAKAREETAGDGLYALAEDFKAKGNDEAWASTLRFLVTRYPSSRRAQAARDDLERAGIEVPSGELRPRVHEERPSTKGSADPPP